DVTNAEGLAVIQAAILIGNFDGVDGLLDLVKIIPCRNAAACTVLLPFMLDQSAVGVILEHVPDSSLGNRLGGLTTDRRTSHVRLRPKTMQYEVRLLARAALIRMIVGMAGAIVRRPGEREHVVIELSLRGVRRRSMPPHGQAERHRETCR